MDNRNFFIGIGPPKTGTSWLYKNLMLHPEIRTTRDKEIRYFWAMEYIQSTGLVKRLSGSHWHFREKRRYFRRSMIKHVQHFFKEGKINHENLAWDFNYLFSHQNDSWYLKLFPADKLTGDITPLYSELSISSVKNVKKLLPNAKIIIGLRDPVDRQWSRTKMNLLKRHGRSSIFEVNKELVYSHLESQIQVNDYVDLIERWEKVFGKENIFIYYFEELKSNPQALFDNICDYLTVPKVKLKNISKRQNIGIPGDIPDEFLEYLIDLNIKYIEELYHRTGNEIVHSWKLKYAKK